MLSNDTGKELELYFNYYLSFKVKKINKVKKNSNENMF